jgi:hypothetical protein
VQNERAILILGDADAPDTVLDEARRYGEVFVVARAVPDPASRYVIDDELAHRRARQRLRQVAARLTAGGTRVSGIVGDADARAARRDSRALFPRASALLEAA